MGSDLKIKTLGEIAENVSRSFDFSSFEEVAFINTGDVLEGRFLHNTFKSKSGLPGQAKKRIEKGDILFSEIRPGNKRYAIVDFDPEGYVVSTKFMVIRLKDFEVDPQYFYTVLTSQATLEEFQRIAESRSGTFPQITFDAVSYYPINIPPLSEQKAIAHILNMLDDKIELNRQMSATLEAMAQALFKSWFVDFDPVIDNALAAGNPIPEPLLARAEIRKALGDQRKSLPDDLQQQFPDRFLLTDEMGWVPERWQVKEIGDILLRLKVNKRYKKKDTERFGDIPVFEQGSNILLGYHNGKPDIIALENEPAFIFGDHTCITKLSIEPFSISENVIALTGKELNTFWVYYALIGKQSFEEYRRHWMELIVKPVIVPQNDLIDAFSNSIKVLVKKQSILSRQINDLVQIRDTLLPKLLSGELQVPEAESIIDKQLTEA